MCGSQMQETCRDFSVGREGVVQQFPIPEVDFPLSDPGISKVHNYYCVV